MRWNWLYMKSKNGMRSWRYMIHCSRSIVTILFTSLNSIKDIFKWINNFFSSTLNIKFLISILIDSQNLRKSILRLQQIKDLISINLQIRTSQEEFLISFLINLVENISHSLYQDTFLIFRMLSHIIHLKGKIRTSFRFN